MTGGYRGLGSWAPAPPVPVEELGRDWAAQYDAEIAVPAVPSCTCYDAATMEWDPAGPCDYCLAALGVDE